jgi:hypothetical protein
MKTLQQRRQGRVRSRRGTVSKPSPSETNREGLRQAIYQSLGSPLQAKLRLGGRDDPQEHAADAVADRVMRAPADGGDSIRHDGIGRDDEAIRRAAAAPDKGGDAEEQEEETLQAKRGTASSENDQEQEETVRSKADTASGQMDEEDEEETVQSKADRAAQSADGRTLGQDTAARIQSRRGQGSGLPAGERGFFEPRLGADLGRVRVHTDTESARLNHRLGARAFTIGNDVFFGGGEYRPGTRAGRHLLAHELAHVLQQRGGAAQAERVSRKLELRPPGKGEHSAFDRAQELVDRLNSISPAIQYQLNGKALEYEIKDEAALTHFDKQMRDFIDRDALVPMRLINHRGRVGGEHLFADSFISAYVDLDDLMADDIYSFQSDLLHFLTERFQVEDYDRKIGTDMSALFPKAHRAGKQAEAEQLQALLNDRSIKFVYEETRDNGTWVNAFKSVDNGFWVFQIVKDMTAESIVGGVMKVKTKDGTWMLLADFIKKRAAAGG